MRPGAPKCVVVVIAGLFAVGCSLNDSESPTVTGPTSQFGLSITMTASPDQLPRDGVSQSLVTITVRDESGRPISGQALAATSNVGRILGNQVVTDSSGRASFTFVAPDATFGGNAAVIQVVPSGGGGQSLIGPTMSIILTGNAGVTNATVPNPQFEASSLTPTMGDAVVFDASATTDEGTRCLDACTYFWDFGGESSANGRIVTYRFRGARTYAVRLTVTDAAGSVASSFENVVVSQGTLPTAAFTFSPTSPGQFQPVNFTAAASRAGEGRTITTYEWRFGDGSTDTGVAPTHMYNVVGTYAVTLTVTDSASLQTSLTQNVTVVNGVTAAFTFSPDDPAANETVFFNAEESRGSDTGFGGRNPITKYIWHFGDSTSTEETTSPIISHAFGSSSLYRVTLTVVDSANRRQTVFEEVTVD